MKKTLILCLVGLLAMTVLAQRRVFLASVLKPAAAGGGNPPASPLINQNFEGTGYDNSETWTTGAGTPDPDYTTGPLVGSQSLRIVGSGNTQYIISPTYTSLSEGWGFCRFKPITIDGSATDIIAFVGSGADRLAVRINGTGTIRIAHGSATATTVDSMSAGTEYWLWFYYKAGTGSNGEAWVGFSTDGIRPTSGNKYVSLTTGTYTQNITAMWLGNYSFNRTWEGLFDHVYVDDEQIGDNP